MSKATTEHKTSKIAKFVPVYEYIKIHKVSKQNVYRWIRERKFEDTDIQVEERMVKRMKIRENAIPKMRVGVIHT